MKILYVSPFLSHPPLSGAALRSFNVLRLLAARHSVSVTAYDESEGMGLRKWCEAHLERSVLLPPPPIPSRPSVASDYLARFLFPPSKSFALRSRPLGVAVNRELSQEARFDLVFLDTHFAGLALPCVQAKTRTLLSLNDILSQYHWRPYRHLHPGKYKLLYWWEWFAVHRMERRLVRTHHDIIVVSDAEAQVLSDRHHPRRSHVIPNGVDTDYFVPPQENSGENVLFVGNFGHGPNREAFWFFYREVWPRVKNILDVQLLVVGRKPPPDIVEVARSDSSVRVFPDQNDVRPFYGMAKVTVCPILNGGGTRVKILESLSMGVPVVSTTIGSEGLEVLHNETILIADDSRGFADRIIELYRDPALAARLSKNGRLLAQAKYDWNVIGQELEKVVTTVAQDPVTRPRPTHCKS